MKKILVIILFAISSCSKGYTSEVSVLENSDCDLPCWNNIVVGETSEEDLLNILSSSPFVDPESVFVTNQPWFLYDNQVFFSLLSKQELFHNQKDKSEIEILDGVVKVMFLCGSLNTSIGRVVQEIGKPEGILSGGNISGGRDVILINSQRGVSYWYSTNGDSSEMEITPNTQVECLVLFEPAYYMTMLDAGMFSMGHYDAEETLKVMYPWDGYGNLDEKYPPRQP